MTAPTPRGRRTASGALAAQTLAINPAEADLLQTELKLLVDGLKQVADDRGNPESYMAGFRRRQLGALIGRLEPLTLDDKDDDPAPSFDS